MKRALAFAGLLAFFFVLAYFNTFSHVRADFTDRLYGGRPALDNIVIVKINDVSINQIGRWPWERDVWVDVLEKLGDARAVGLDVSFFEPSGQDERLNATLQLMDNVVLAAEFQDDTFYRPIFDADYGYVNLATDPDGITRRFEVRDGAVPFAFQLYRMGWKQDAELTKPFYRINFAGAPGTFASISVQDVLASNQSFANRIVLVGATAPNLHDEYFVPTSEGVAMPGVEIHANILQSFILNNFVTKQSVWAIIALVVIVGALGMFLVSRMKIYWVLSLVPAAIIAYGIVTIIAMQRFNYLMDVFFVPLALLAFTGAGVGMNYLEEKQRTAYLRDAFSKYVSKDLLNELLKSKQELKLGGVKREITVFFSDIRGFTSISEKMEPEQLVHQLNEYFTAMTRIILKHGGTVDKFIGDAIMAFWNAPVEEKDHAKLACRAALEQIEALKDLQKKWAEQNLPAIKIGCGIHTGPAIIGNLGSEERFDYTAIGDTVNLASRLEGLTKEHDAAIIITESTYEKVKDAFECKKIGTTKVKGKEESVVIYALLRKV